ncbi:MAG: formate--tetrahydrofolate ligase [Myxococcota bacterium]
MTKPIEQVAASLSLAPDEFEIYGRSKAKVSLTALDRRKNAPDGKLVIVTAINPTPAGEGKTVNTISLGDGFARKKKRAIVCIREPSLGPTFGVKGGGAGGGKAQAYPGRDLNLHFTGDFHAITAAHNLIAALTEAHVYHGNGAGFGPNGFTWNRVLDVTDRALRDIVVGLGGKANGAPRQTGFEISAASELMALLALSKDFGDMRRRLQRVVLGTSKDGKPITAGDIEVAGPAAVLLRDALLPNLIQTLEGTPLFAHTGPFGNIATGHNSVIEDRLALKLGEVITAECGFGSDLGFEKFCHLVAPELGRGPDVAVVVATVRGLKAHSGKFKLAVGKPLPKELDQEDLEAIRAGASNLEAHIKNVRQFGVPVVVAVNHFPSDTDKELALIAELALGFGAEKAAIAEGFARGGEGTSDLADAALAVMEKTPSRFQTLFPVDAPLADKIQIVATKVYGAAKVEFAPAAKKKLEDLQAWGYGKLPVCMAKTAYSFSHDASLLGAPKGFTLPVEDLGLAAGAGFVKVFSGDILTMPGFGAKPQGLKMDLDDAGNFVGIE